MFLKKMVKKSSFFQVKNIVAKISHGDNTTVESHSLNRIQESEYTNKISFYFICILFFVIFQPMKNLIYFYQTILRQV